MSSVPFPLGAGPSTRKFGQRTANVSTVVGGNRGRQQQHSRWNPKAKQTQKLPLTHFISIPIVRAVLGLKLPRYSSYIALIFLSKTQGHHPGIHTKWIQVTRSLLDTSPAIPGLDESVIIKPGGLHITLGVMSLRTEEESCKRVMKKRETQADADVNPSETPQLHSVQDALVLLRTLREPIRELINDGSSLDADPLLYLPLDQLDIMRNGRNNESDNAHVLWAGPDLDGELGKRFGRVCELVHSRFKEAGYLQDLRPLKLHCTLINTVYRKHFPQSSFTLADAMTGAPQAKDNSSSRRQQHRNQRERIPFSYQSILSSAAYRLISVSDAGTTTAASGSGPYRIDLGLWPVDEIQICRMGSQDGLGFYKSVGGISLR